MKRPQILSINSLDLISMSTKEIKSIIIENFIDWYFHDEDEREVIKSSVDVYVKEDHVDEIAQSIGGSKFKIISGGSPDSLNLLLEDYITKGWEPVGTHSVVVLHSQNRYSGTQHMDTIHKSEYSITMRNTNLKNQE